MKITERLFGDHKTFRKMIQDIVAITNESSEKRDNQKLVRTVELFKDHLMLHAWFEDTFYYPAVSSALIKKTVPPLSPEYMNHLKDEHKTIDGYLTRLEEELKEKPVVTTWPQTFSLFYNGLRLHMKKEEEEPFPISEQLLGVEKLEELSEEIERHRQEAPKVRIHSQINSPHLTRKK